MPYTKSGIHYSAKPTPVRGFGGRQAVMAEAARLQREGIIFGQRNKPRAGYSTVPRSRGAYASGEMKYFDTERTATAIPASTDWTSTHFPPNVGTPTTLVVPTQGSAINQRIGRRIKLMKLHINGLIQSVAQTSGSPDDGCLIRLALVQDMQTNATQAVGPDIFQAPTGATAILATNSHMALTNLGRFKILKDKRISFNNSGVAFQGTAGQTVQNGYVVPFKMNIKFPVPLEVSFNAVNGGTIADVVDHSFCLYATCTSAAFVPRISYQCRAYFKE